ncbi:hypothetical protein HFN60_30240 [Rhizobium leguminosarum]|uniref:hypothetical protein n=1 Tax=Rhizobium leguminosarum TaxID=384 RepID=UPI001C96180A|nr:hypothetical protein [Rhizobium leguminosarum]MBY5819874.1 hypothetical protein [Rhizobium leguminosarum]
MVRTIKLPSSEEFFWLLNKREAKHVANLLEGAEFKSMPITFRALVANFAVQFGDSKGRKPLKISLEWLDFIEKFTTTDSGDAIGKLTDEAGQQVRFIRPVPEQKAITPDDVALLDKYFGPVETPPQAQKYRRPGRMLPVPDYLNTLGIEPRNSGYAAIKLSIERIRMKKTT